MIALLTLVAAAAPNLIVVSLDTTRADALSCYGAPESTYDATPDRPRTPVLDALAAEGVRFDRFFAQSPSTLASHATLFTGRDPHGTGVARNGFPLAASHTTLAERLAAVGYDTRAVLGALALESGTGIEQGFAVWDDESPTLRGLMYQSPAPEVVRRAFAAVDARDPSAPLFLFVHFFDAHAPYEAPEPYNARFQDPAYDGRFGDPRMRNAPVIRRLRKGEEPGADAFAINGRYYAEVAALDAQIGVLLEGLAARGVLDDALVVVVGDHGEVLTERPVYAWTHGNDVSTGVTRVPLLMRAYGSVPLARRTVVTRTAGMASVAPTLEAALGLDVTLGRSMWDLVRPGPVDTTEGWPERPMRIVRQEATRPRNLEDPDDWNNLPFERAVIAGPWRLDAFPLEGQPPVVREGPAPIGPVLAGVLHRWDHDGTPHVTADMAPHQVRALKALGYLQDDPVPKQ